MGKPNGSLGDSIADGDSLQPVWAHVNKVILGRPVGGEPVEDITKESHLILQSGSMSRKIRRQGSPLSVVRRAFSMTCKVAVSMLQSCRRWLTLM